MIFGFHRLGRSTRPLHQAIFADRRFGVLDRSASGSFDDVVYQEDEANLSVLFLKTSSVDNHPTGVPPERILWLWERVRFTVLHRVLGTGRIVGIKLKG